MRAQKFISFRFFIFLFFISLILAGSLEAGVVLKLVALNPSKTQAQKVQLKTFLPKEIKPEDIIDKEDLSVAYDTQQGSYFVYGDYELKPGEFLEKQIELKDIWVVPQDEIDSLFSESKRLRDLLKNTEMADRIAFLSAGIESKLNQIAESQKNAPVNPERHISNYRDNLKVLESVKSDLVLARSLLAQARPVAPMVIWRMITGIVIFLGLLGLSFYLIWHKQVKAINELDTFYVPKEDKPSATGAKPTARESSAKEKKEEVSDIEKIIKKEEE